MPRLQPITHREGSATLAPALQVRVSDCPADGTRLLTVGHELVTEVLGCPLRRCDLSGVLHVLHISLRAPPVQAAA